MTRTKFSLLSTINLFSKSFTFTDKKNRSQKNESQAEGPKQGHPSDEDLTDDSVSVLSNQSDGSLALGFDLPETTEEVDESIEQENFEDKVKDVIDGLTQKR